MAGRCACGQGAVAQGAGSRANLDGEVVNSGDCLNIRQVCGGVVLECPAWTLQVFNTGRYILMPPPGWLVQLVSLEFSGVISHASAVLVFEAWRAETISRIVRGLEALRDL